MAAAIAVPTEAPRTNLPAPLTSFIGREQELADVTALLGTARLLGQTTGAALVALFLGRYPIEGTRIALLTGVGFALCGAALSMLRLSPAGARGAEHVRVQDDQRLRGD